MNKKMSLKNNKKKKNIRFKIKIIIYLIIIYLSFSYTFYNTMKNSQELNNKEFINYIVNGGSIDKLNELKLPIIINKTVNMLLNVDFSKPVSILNTSILGQQKQKINTVNLKSDEDYSNLEELKTISKYIENPNPIDINNPIIYIYNTHQLENYNNKNLDIYGITPNVMMASYLLKEKLNRLGYATIVEDTNITELLNINNWDYASSYKASRLLILDKKNKYPSLKYYIDLHRDSVNKDSTLIEINKKKYAKILFVVGLEHNNYQKNLELASKLNTLFNNKYPNISRGVLKKEGPNVDGIYNQDLNENSMLIELGGIDNNIEEVLNTINAISEIISIYINDQK